MIGSNDFFTIRTSSLSWAYMIFLIAHNPKITFTTIIHKLTNRFMLLRFHCLMLCKTVSTTKSFFTVHTTSVRISNITILAVVYTSTNSCHFGNCTIVIYPIEVNMDHPRLRLLLDLKWKYQSIFRILRMDFNQVLGCKFRLELLVFLNTTDLV